MTSLNPIYTVGYQIREVLSIHRQVLKDQANELTVDMLQKVGLW